MDLKLENFHNLLERIASISSVYVDLIVSPITCTNFSNSFLDGLNSCGLL